MSTAVASQVAPLINAARERGVEAVLEFTERFNRGRPANVRVPAASLHTALSGLNLAVRAALEELIARARRVHED
jgi:histidinol dehydrogenase